MLSNILYCFGACLQLQLTRKYDTYKIVNDFFRSDRGFLSTIIIEKTQSSRT